MPSRRTLTVGLTILSLLVLSALPSNPAAQKDDSARQFRFGAEMAKQGNWHEAIFRWGRALALDPGNTRLHNNLAVAYESLGEYKKAESEYQAALASPDVPDEIRENHELFLRFYKEYKDDLAEPANTGKAATAPPSENGH